MFPSTAVEMKALDESNCFRLRKLTIHGLTSLQIVQTEAPGLNIMISSLARGT